MLDDYAKKYDWALIGDCIVTETGEVDCSFSREVFIDESIEDYHIFLQQANLNDTWLKLVIKNMDSGVKTTGVPVLWNETILVNGELANSTEAPDAQVA